MPPEHARSRLHPILFGMELVVFGLLALLVGSFLIATLGHGFPARSRALAFEALELVCALGLVGGAGWGLRESLGAPLSRERLGRLQNGLAWLASLPWLAFVILGTMVGPAVGITEGSVSAALLGVALASPTAIPLLGWWLCGRGSGSSTTAGLAVGTIYMVPATVSFLFMAIAAAAGFAA